METFFYAGKVHTESFEVKLRFPESVTEEERVAILEHVRRKIVYEAKNAMDIIIRERRRLT